MRVRLDRSDWHDVSDVPCDSLRQLIEALSRSLDGSHHESVEWSLEPDYAEWIFERDVDRLIFLVKSNSESYPELHSLDNAPQLVAAIVDALVTLESSDVWKRDEGEFRIWSWPFPSSELMRLRTQLAEPGVAANALPGSDVIIN